MSTFNDSEIFEKFWYRYLYHLSSPITMISEQFLTYPPIQRYINPDKKLFSTKTVFRRYFRRHFFMFYRYRIAKYIYIQFSNPMQFLKNRNLLGIVGLSFVTVRMEFFQKLNFEKRFQYGKGAWILNDFLHAILNLVREVL